MDRELIKKIAIIGFVVFVVVGLIAGVVMQ